MNTILVIDDDKIVCELLKDYFEEEGFIVDLAPRAEQGLEKLRETNPFLVILNQVLPDAKGTEILRMIKEYAPQTHVLMISDNGETSDTLQAIELGAMNSLSKPLDLARLNIFVQQAQRLTTIARELDIYRKRIETQVKERWTPLLFNSQLMKEIFKHCQEVVDASCTILLEGESGVGKGLFAHYIHQVSDRASGPFIDVDCATISEMHLETELFGYEPETITDTKTRKEGLIEFADSGTLFLDEITGLPLHLQHRLVELIEKKSFTRPGTGRKIHVDVRIIAATNHNLAALVDRGKFRKDLYSLISTFAIKLPALRDRKEDIVPLAKHFLAEFNKELHKGIKEIEPDALEALAKYDWPGNIRELRNAMEKAVINAQDNNVTVNNLPIDIIESDRVSASKTLYYKEAKRQFESEILEKALKHAHGNQSQAARTLGISRNALIRRMQKYHINFLRAKKPKT